MQPDCFRPPSLISPRTTIWRVFLSQPFVPFHVALALRKQALRATDHPRIVAGTIFMQQQRRALLAVGHIDPHRYQGAQERNHVKLLPVHPPSTIFFEVASHHGLELLIPIFLPACEAISAALSTGNVVGLFCISGLSRAPAVAAAYLMAYRGMSVVDAVHCVSSQRSCVHFSDSILRQLHEFELLQKSRLSVASFVGSAAAATTRKRSDSTAPNVQPPQSCSADC